MRHLVKTNEGVSPEQILIAYQQLKNKVAHTPLQQNKRLSEKYHCNVYLKREDLQYVRSFKLRGAFYAMLNLSKEELQNGIVCASAGNHAQGVAYACNELKVMGKIYMPTTTPRQKVNQVELFGKEYVEIILIGDTFDDSFIEARKCEEAENRAFIHPFNDQNVISGQGTVAVEIFHDIDVPVDYIFGSVGGGGLMSGIAAYSASISPATACIGVEPVGAPSMQTAIKEGQVVKLPQIDSFVDGAAVKEVGEKTFAICRDLLKDVVTVPEGKVCTTILELYNEHAIVAEPAGAMSVAALDLYQEQLVGKTVVCIISGGNNDIGRMQDIKDRSLQYEGLLHHFIVHFPQRAGALREFLDEVLGPNDDITRFEYTKKNNKDNGPALVGIELQKREDYNGLMQRMENKGFQFVEVKKGSSLHQFLI
ncbi:threonine ammonia-lyase IlvA [Bacillus sp. E214]|uniref:threonine ammonia-lyase IlvA n=1 Tax=Bacillus sp. E214 TaxID=2587156 RepID=UPI0011DFADD5|nr:threonine ammonia-lyase IlvA [Bacillus sp. E214]